MQIILETLITESVFYLSTQFYAVFDFRFYKLLVDVILEWHLGRRRAILLAEKVIMY